MIPCNTGVAYYLEIELYVSCARVSVRDGVRDALFPGSVHASPVLVYADSSIFRFGNLCLLRDGGYDGTRGKISRSFQP